jgi:hypothetical protein
METRAMEDEAKPVEECLHEPGDLERIVRGGENDSVGRLDLLDEHVPVIMQRAELLALFKARLASSTGLEAIVFQADNFVFHVTKRLQIAQELQDCIVRVPFAGTSNECSDSLHVFSP